MAENCDRVTLSEVEGRHGRMQCHGSTPLTMTPYMPRSMYVQMFLTCVSGEKDIIADEETTFSFCLFHSSISRHSLLGFWNSETLEGEGPGEIAHHFYSLWIISINHNDDLQFLANSLPLDVFEAVTQDLGSFSCGDDDGEGRHTGVLEYGNTRIQVGQWRHAATVSFSC